MYNVVLNIFNALYLILCSAACSYGGYKAYSMAMLASEYSKNGLNEVYGGICWFGFALCVCMTMYLVQQVFVLCKK